MLFLKELLLRVDILCFQARFSKGEKNDQFLLTPTTMTSFQTVNSFVPLWMAGYFVAGDPSIGPGIGQWEILRSVVAGRSLPFPSHTDLRPFPSGQRVCLSPMFIKDLRGSNTVLGAGDTALQPEASPLFFLTALFSAD